MNTATGTKQEKLSDDERADRRRGMKLVSRGKGSTNRFRIAMSQDLVNSFRNSEAATLDPMPVTGSTNDAISRSNKENASPGKVTTDTNSTSSVPTAITLTAVALTGVMVGYLLRRGRE